MALVSSSKIRAGETVSVRARVIDTVSGAVQTGLTSAVAVFTDPVGVAGSPIAASLVGEYWTAKFTVPTKGNWNVTFTGIVGAETTIQSQNFVVY